MARSRNTQGETPGPAFLLVPREQFAQELEERISAGQSLVDREITSQEELDNAKSDFYTWSEFNAELLKRRFSTPEPADDYSYWGIIGVGSQLSFAEEVKDYRNDVQTKLRRLRSLKEKLPIIDESHHVVTDRASAPAKDAPISEIFVVHGHNDEVKLAVHGFIRQITNVRAVILHDEPSGGKTSSRRLSLLAAGRGTR